MAIDIEAPGGDAEELKTALKNLVGDGDLSISGHIAVGGEASIDGNTFNEGYDFTALLSVSETITQDPLVASYAAFIENHHTTTGDDAYIGGIFYSPTIAAENTHSYEAIDGITSSLTNHGAGDIGTARLNYCAFLNAGAADVGQVICSYSSISNTGGGTVDQAIGFWFSAARGFSPVTTLYASFVADLSNAATNPYYEWHDSQGVRRVKEDATFDTVGQAIEALYNPQFDKYTPGAVNFERVILGQWNGNVAEIGNEAGGTGVLRPLRLIGSSVHLPTYDVAGLPSAATEGAGAAVYCSNGNAGAKCLAVSDGSNWKVVALGATVSAS